MKVLDREGQMEVLITRSADWGEAKEEVKTKKKKQQQQQQYRKKNQKKQKQKKKFLMAMCEMSKISHVEETASYAAR